MTIVTCPMSVVTAGAHLVKIRHGVKSPEDAKHVGLDHADKKGLLDAFKETIGHIHAAMLDLRQYGVMEMEWGPGLLHFDNAERSMRQGDDARAWAEILCAHNCFRQVLDTHGIANPTNAEIAGVIAYGNWR